MTIGKGGKSVVSYVINQLCTNKNKQTSTPEFGEENSEIVVAAISLSFRLCMGNVLIRTYQKMLEACKKPFAAQVIPFPLPYREFETKSETRTACTTSYFQQSII